MAEPMTMQTWHGNITLSDWAQRWRCRHVTDEDFACLVQALSSACYARPADADMKALSGAFVALLRKPNRWRTGRRSRPRLDSTCDLPYAPSQ